jgi:hypothetical protein
VLLTLLLALPLAAAGCGLRTEPRPLSQVLPASEGLRAWQREDALTVSWPVPGGALAERFGGVRGVELAVRVWPLLCPECPPPTARRLWLPADAPELEHHGGRVYLALPLEPEAGRLRLELRVRYGKGLAPRGPAVVVERAGEIPTPDLRWRPAAREGAAPVVGARTVQFYWTPVQARIVYVVGADGHPREQVRHYRANLYRRIPPAPWPPAPLNAAPLAGVEWTVPPVQASFPTEAPGEEYHLRFVDVSGNEGPPSPSVLVPLPGRAS